jgi:hypothetical protein
MTESDLRELLDVVHAGYDDEPGDAMPGAVLRGLARLIPCANITFLELESRREVILVAAR